MKTIIISAHAVTRYIQRVQPAFNPQMALDDIKANLPLTVRAGKKCQKKFRWFGYNSDSVLLVYAGVGYLVVKNDKRQNVLATILIKNYENQIEEAVSPQEVVKALRSEGKRFQFEERLWEEVVL